ncbi:MAG: selenocysteine-specific translation elongation factor [Schaedlerella sp.]|nr:selenocysteine-specific translation elongation factor [Schaedlerella sp.]
MKHIIIGTAGHIDHGKTTLIKALTGEDTDRLSEEKRRGITIELGFTYFDLPGGGRVGIVDVPGHEKFIKNMVSGVVGMDMVLLVIAADEGIMTQTREHMDILNLLGVKKCIVVLNKIDLADPEWCTLIEDEIKDELRGRFPNEPPVVKVSSITGQGIEELIKQIEQMTETEVEPKEIHTIPRLPIDRVFTIAGFGTVVTGTLLSGQISKEDILMTYPTGKVCRIRNIQVHGKDVEQCFAGQRVAINITNINKNEIRRGCVLAPVDSMKNTKLLDVKLHILESSDKVLKNNMRLHLFTGTEEVLCRAVLLDKEELYPGENGYVQLRLENEVAVRRKDRFVIRFYSPLETIGGGLILEPNPKKKKRFHEETINELRKKEEGSSADILELHIKESKETLITVNELARMTSRSETEVSEDIEWLQKEGTVITFPMKKDTYIWHEDDFTKAKKLLLNALKKYEQIYPYRYGIRKPEIQMQLFSKIKTNVFDKIIEEMERADVIVRKNDLLCIAGREIPKDQIFIKTEDKYLSILKGAKYEFVKDSEIVVEEISKEILEDIKNVLENEQMIVNVADDIYTVKETMDRAERMIREHLFKNTSITIIQIKEMFETSRKNAKLIVEYMDRKKVTKKNGAETERILY